MRCCWTTADTLAAELGSNVSPTTVNDAIARSDSVILAVWFNVLNEPGHGKPPPMAWLTIHERLIKAVRSEGAASSWEQVRSLLRDALADEALARRLAAGPG